MDSEGSDDGGDPKAENPSAPACWRTQRPARVAVPGIAATFDGGERYQKIYGIVLIVREAVKAREPTCRRRTLSVRHSEGRCGAGALGTGVRVPCRKPRAHSQMHEHARSAPRRAGLTCPGPPRDRSVSCTGP